MNGNFPFPDDGDLTGMVARDNMALGWTRHNHRTTDWPLSNKELKIESEETVKTRHNAVAESSHLLVLSERFSRQYTQKEENNRNLLTGIATISNSRSSNQAQPAEWSVHSDLEPV